MEMNPAVAAAPNHYQAVFRGHFVRRTQMLLTRLNRSEPVPPPEVVKQAFQALTCAPHVAESWPHTRSLLLTLAPKLEQAGYRDEWLAYLEQGLRQSQWLGDLATAAELHLQAGILHQLRTNYPVARTHLELSVDAFAQLQSPADQARALNRLAYVARLQRRFEEAVQLVETVQDLLETEAEEWAFGLYVLGLVALDKREWQEAIRFSQQALNLWEQKNNQRMMGRSLMCMGVAMEKMRHYEQAIQASERAIALFEAGHDPIYQATVQINLGIIYNGLEQPDRALTFFLPAQKQLQRAQDRYSLALVAHNMGMSYRKLRRWTEAITAYALSIELKQEIGDMIALANSMDGLGLVYFEQGEFSQARTTFEAALACLTNIESDPGYPQRYEMISAHLAEVNQLSVP